jgi:hypothetical protein
LLGRRSSSGNSQHRDELESLGEVSFSVGGDAPPERSARLVIQCGGRFVDIVVRGSVEIELGFCQPRRVQRRDLSGFDELGVLLAQIMPAMC